MLDAPSIETRMAVQDLLMRYVWATDTGDVDGFVAAFVEDATLISSSGEEYRGHDGIRRFALAQISPAGVRGRMHFFQPIRFEMQEDGVRVVSFWAVAQWTVKGNVKRLRSMGSTTDLCVETRCGWLFQRREIGRWNDETAPWGYKA